MPPKKLSLKTAKGATSKKRKAVEVDEPPTSTPSRPPKTRVPVVEKDYVDIEDSDQYHNSEDEKVVIGSTPVRDPSIATSSIYYTEPAPPKRPKLGSNQVPTPLKPLGSIQNFHVSFKSDVEAAFRESEDVLLRVNFHIRVAAWQSFEFNKDLRVNFVQAAFGITRAQAFNMDVEDDREVKGPRALGLVVGKQIRKYSNVLMKNMRENFLCLLRMLFEYEGAQKMLESLLVVVETRGARAFNEHYSVIEEEEINEIFIKNNVYLVADVWGPVMDVVDKDYLLTAPDWSGKFINRTCQILAWLLSYFIKSSKNSRDDMRNFDHSHPCIPTELQTNALMKGNIVPNGNFPEIKRPDRWTRRPVLCNYGKLQYTKLAEKEAENFIEELIDGVLEDESSGIKVPKMPVHLDEVLDTMETVEQGEWFRELFKAKRLSMSRVKVELDKGIKTVEETCLGTEGWFKELKIAMAGSRNTRMQTILAERFKKGIRAIFVDAEAREKGLAISAKLGFVGLDAEQNIEGLSTTEIWGLFNSAVDGYDIAVARLRAEEQTATRSHMQGQGLLAGSLPAGGKPNGGSQIQAGEMQGGMFMPPQMPTQMSAQMAEGFFKAWFQQNGMMGVPTDQEMHNRALSSPVESVGARGASQGNEESKEEMTVDGLGTSWPSSAGSSPRVEPRHLSV
ncbi:hypothetical protein BGX38DRAFT_1141966 [Terfezia claveryi]|nr:hypothetical protein BGX38DRAFT_1141966 [Terfezia claveryi]